MAVTTGMRTIAKAMTITALLAGVGRAELANVQTFGDILFWAGSGTNAAALVLQFPTTTTSGSAAPAAIAWGYRWNGSATMEQMVFSLAGTIIDGPAPVAGSDSRLAMNVADYGTQQASDYFVDSIAYAQNGLPAGWSPVTREMPGWDGTNWVALYTLAGNGSWTGDPFVVSDVGMSSIALGAGDWYGFVQAAGPATFSFAQPVAAVPEPNPWAAAVCGCLTALVARRLRARRS
jgi:hypothetical protein